MNSLLCIFHLYILFDSKMIWNTSINFRCFLLNRECREQRNKNREPLWEDQCFGSHSSRFLVHSPHVRATSFCILPNREEETNVFKTFVSVSWRRRTQNNATGTWGERTRMWDECDANRCFSLFVSHRSLQSWQWKRSKTEITCTALFLCYCNLRLQNRLQVCNRIDLSQSIVQPCLRYKCT